MSYKDKAIMRDVFNLVPETCPHVDAALEVAAEAIKKQTNSMRNALIDLMTEVHDLREKLEDAEKEISNLQNENEDLKSELQEALESREYA